MRRWRASRQGSAYIAFFSGIARPSLRRWLCTIGIESSCDDTSVAILETLETARSDYRSQSDPHAPPPPKSIYARLLFHEKVTADNSQYGGIHPIAALDSHQANLGHLLARALSHFRREASSGLAWSHASMEPFQPLLKKWKPDLVAVTRGPGMRSNLSTGLDTAKGMALAWSVPLIAIHHMQAHALTPRLAASLSSTALGTPLASGAIIPSAPLTRSGTPLSPTFPFLSLLVSGGHTLLLNSTSITQHSILATTSDIAIGDALDKIARNVIPPEILRTLQDTAYARALEKFVFPSGAIDHVYEAPVTRQAELERRKSRWGWALGVPLAETRSGSKSKSMEFSFTGLDSSVRRIALRRKAELDEELSVEERRDLGREAMRVAFEHLASRVVMALQAMRAGGIGDKTFEVDTLVVSGGVASNMFLRTLLRSFLDARSYSHVKLSFPPIELCTDNAAMVAWTGYEMFREGYESDLSCRAIRKWSLDENAEDGGILGVAGWKRSDEGVMGI